MKCTRKKMTKKRKRRRKDGRQFFGARGSTGNWFLMEESEGNEQINSTSKQGYVMIHFKRLTSCSEIFLTGGRGLIWGIVFLDFMYRFQIFSTLYFSSFP